MRNLWRQLVPYSLQLNEIPVHAREAPLLFSPMTRPYTGSLYQRPRGGGEGVGLQ